MPHADLMIGRSLINISYTHISGYLVTLLIEQNILERLQLKKKIEYYIKLNYLGRPFYLLNGNQIYFLFFFSFTYIVLHIIIG